MWLINVIKRLSYKSNAHYKSLQEEHCLVIDSFQDFSLSPALFPQGGKS